MIQDSSEDEDSLGKFSPGTDDQFPSNVALCGGQSDNLNGSIHLIKEDSDRDSYRYSVNSGISTTDLAKDGKEHEIDERERLQIYVFVARCIAYPFSAKYRYDMNYKPPKITLAQLQLARERFLSFLQGDLKIPFDDAFFSVANNYYEVVLKSDEIADIVNGPGWTMPDFSEVFKKSVQRRLSSLPEIKCITKGTLLNNWMEKFEFIFKGESDQRKVPLTPSTIFNSIDTKMTKDQLYDLFQKILHIKKHQHQILFNMLQLDNNDEQAAQVRRELDNRMQEVQELEKNVAVERCLTKEMDKYFAEESKLSIENLKASLRSVPVSKDDDDCKDFSTFQMDIRERQLLSKHDRSLVFHASIIIKDLRGLTSLDKNKVLFCLFQMDGCDKLSTNRTEASSLSWDVQADFTTNCPLPHVKVKLCEESSGLLTLDDKELARVNLMMKMSNGAQTGEWHQMQASRNCPDKCMEIKLISILEKPKNVKNFGYLYCQGKFTWKKWKKRYFILVQVSQFIFRMCSYQENKPEFKDSLFLNDFTLDYCDKVPGLEGGHSYFMLTKEGDEVIFATDDEESLASWIQTLYRATGQTFKPQLPSENQKSLLRFKSESERICKKILDELAQACPIKFDHQEMFLSLQKHTIEFRIKDPFICTYGWLSSDQVYVLDEYCARYGVRVFMRHLGYLEVLMDRAYNKIFIDPSLLYQKFSFCVAHIHGNKPDRAYTVLKEEKERFMEMSYKLFKYLEYIITNFRLTFPFGRPENGLKISLSLLERVSREINYFENRCNSEQDGSIDKEIIQPISGTEMYATIKKFIDQSLYNSYDQITKSCNLEGALNDGDADKVKDTYMLVAQDCIQMYQQVTEYHADAFSAYKNLINENLSLLWTMYLMDLCNFLCCRPLSPDLWNFFSLFQLINEYCLSHGALSGGTFHRDVCSTFAPIVIHYLENMELSIMQSLNSFFKGYVWKPSNKSCCSVASDLLWKLECLGNFIQDLNWPDEIFLEHLKNRLASINYETVLIFTSNIGSNFEQILKKSKKPTECLLCEELFMLFEAITKLLDAFPPRSAVDKHLAEVSEKMISSFAERLLVELDDVLSEISKYDSNKYLLSVFSFKKPEQLAKSFIEFVQFGLLQIERNVLNKSFLHRILEGFFLIQVEKLTDWLGERNGVRLHTFQLQTLTVLWNKLSSLSGQCKLREDILESKDCKAILVRIEMESIV